MLCSIMHTVETVSLARRERIIVIQLLDSLRCCRSRKSCLHYRVRWKMQRGSLITAGICKQQSKVEPAEWEQEGELFVSTFSCPSVLRDSSHTFWVDGGDLTPSHEWNASIAHQILLPLHLLLSPLSLYFKLLLPQNLLNIVSFKEKVSYTVLLLLKRT